MKKFIGIKKVEAKPMTRGEYNKYRGWQIPADENPNDEGYLVKYSDDYISWSPKKAFDEAYREAEKYPLVDTALLMRSDNYKDRFRAEYEQLKIRSEKLFDMLQKYKSGAFKFTPTCDYEILEKQYFAMQSYLLCLEKRAKIENV